MITDFQLGLLRQKNFHQPKLGLFQGFKTPVVGNIMSNYVGKKYYHDKLTSVRSSLRQTWSIIKAWSPQNPIISDPLPI